MVAAFSIATILATATGHGKVAEPWAVGEVVSLEPMEWHLIAIMPTEAAAVSLCLGPMHFVGPMEPSSPDAYRVVWSRVRYPNAGKVM